MTDVFASLGGLLWTGVTYLVPFFFVLALVIFIHELGHYLVGRWCGVKVETFAIGFGPQVFGWRDGSGTLWKLGLIPLGGMVKFKGDLNGASMEDYSVTDTAETIEDRKDTFQFQAIWKRAAIVAAGPIANFILAIGIFAATFVFSGRYEIDPVIGHVSENSPAAAAGFLAGDKVVAVNAQPVKQFDDLRRLITSSPEGGLIVDVMRAGKVASLTVVPRVTEQKTTFGVLRSRTIGVGASIQPEHHRMVTYGPVESVGLAVEQCYQVLEQTVRYISGLLAGREKTDQLSGPIRIAQVSGKVAEAGFVALLSLAAFLSVSIGFVNLMPIPILDGGHLVFYAYEAIVGRPMNRKVLEVAFKVGLFLIIGLMIFTTFNDIVQIKNG